MAYIQGLKPTNEVRPRPPAHAKAPPTMWFLKLVDDDTSALPSASPPIIHLSTGTTLICRESRANSPHCTVLLPSNHISLTHAYINLAPDSMPVLVDCSMNGCRVMRQSKRMPSLRKCSLGLEEGDEVRFGLGKDSSGSDGREYRYLLHAAPAAPADEMNVDESSTSGGRSVPEPLVPEAHKAVVVSHPLSTLAPSSVICRFSVFLGNLYLDQVLALTLTLTLMHAHTHTHTRTHAHTHVPRDEFRAVACGRALRRASSVFRCRRCSSRACSCSCTAQDTRSSPSA